VGNSLSGEAGLIKRAKYDNADRESQMDDQQVGSGLTCEGKAVSAGSGNS
jgi:hypothetical protein